MKKVYVWTLLAAALIVPIAGAQQVADKPPAADRSTSMTVEFSSTDQLLAEGWEEVEPFVWRKVFDNGMAAEIALDKPAIERTRAWIDADIEALQALDELDAIQELELLEFLIRREQLAEAELSLKGYTSSCGSSLCYLCTGNAVFEHDFGWVNSAYVFAEMDSTFNRWYQAGSATSYARAKIMTSSGASYQDPQWSSGSGLVVSAYSYMSVPTWSGSAHANGSVTLNGVSGNCATAASYTAFPWYF